MNKFLLIFSFILMTFLASVAIANEQGENNANLNESLNHLMSEKQLKQFCSEIGVTSNTRIKIDLPTGATIFGTIVCKKPQ
ncbi:MAG: hypothetical protein L3J15_04240 [Devosiaceae bacterium]|nr:hypothetical protein [Devosiaceae bacterium]